MRCIKGLCSITLPRQLAALPAALAAFHCASQTLPVSWRYYSSDRKGARTSQASSAANWKLQDGLYVQKKSNISKRVKRQIFEGLDSPTAEDLEVKERLKGGTNFRDQEV